LIPCRIETKLASCTADLKKLYSYCDCENKIKLQEKVFVDLMLYFGRGGRGNIHELKLSDFAATSDSNGKMYVYMTTDELTKNHRDNENSASARMYASQGMVSVKCS
jgi:hypothetical protein